MLDTLCYHTLLYRMCHWKYKKEQEGLLIYLKSQKISNDTTGGRKTLRIHKDIGCQTLAYFHYLTKNLGVHS